MLFEVSAAKREILQKLAERDWTPTELADELGKSRETMYNHLDGLADRGVLSTSKVAAKTRPRTEYSLESGFLHYVAVLPGQYAERTVPMDEHKQAILRIWNLPQESFHPYVQRLWLSLANADAVDLERDVTAVALYGSVARGDADEESDVDVLLVAEDEGAEATLREAFGTRRIDVGGESKIAIAEVYTKGEYRESLAQGSQFLDGIREDLHVLYDPTDFLRDGGRPA